MHDVAQPACHSLTLRLVPGDVMLAIKRGLAEYNVAHPDHKLSQTDVVTVAIREWVERGGQLPGPTGPASQG